MPIIICHQPDHNLVNESDVAVYVIIYEKVSGGEDHAGSIDRVPELRCKDRAKG